MKVTAKGGSLQLRLEEYEAGLMRNLLGEMATLLEVGIEQDPVNKRLFPRAYDDDEDESSYRELTGDQLQTEKLAALRRVRSDVGTAGEALVDLDEEGLGIWLRLLTDLRLAIGTRLGISEDVIATEPDPTDPDAVAMSVLHWLGWMQESILERTEAGGGGDARER